jgi:hypothetical protein
MTKSLIILVLLLKSCASNSNQNASNQDSLNQSKNIQTLTTSKKEMPDSNFLSYWQKFADVVKASNYSQLKEMSLDTLECEHTNIHVEAFIKSHFGKVFSDSVLLKIADTEKMDFINAAMEPTYFSPSVKQQIKNGNYTIKEVNITTGKYPDVLITTLKFIETDKGYKFYGYDRFGG